MKLMSEMDKMNLMIYLALAVFVKTKVMKVRI